MHIIKTHLGSLPGVVKIEIWRTILQKDYDLVIQVLWKMSNSILILMIPTAVVMHKIVKRPGFHFTNDFFPP